uniref:Ubiquitin carboxyl-terminal hydrolase 48 n=1 Tax=Ixodes ricinus TaxID=34613 RepID=A0A147BGD4_IXORI
MPSKQQLEKAAWQWAESVDPLNITREHVEAAYRIKCATCKANTCRRNCSGNPRCLSGLGERAWIQDVKDSAWHDIEDPNSERRTEGSFVGLKNLGATCYLNSFLQVWYHNPVFRQALYMWDPLHDPQEKEKCHAPNGDVAPSAEGGNAASNSPASVIGHLQLTFALLQFSKRRYIDPTPFISCLGLNTTQQQDAQEFSKLFISLVENRLSFQEEENVRCVVQQQYSGQYNYVTKCLECSTESLCASEFYELDLNIKGHKVLEQALNEFLQEERLEGSNQYHCEVCGGMRNAVRRIQLQRLPPVLNLQLLRFVFDRATGCKKKIKSSLRFPEHLDLSSHLKKPAGTVEYSLAAVLNHQGPSANSGHYVAHIKDRLSGAWFSFNDEEVCKMPGSLLQLSSEENVASAASSGPAKQPGQKRKQAEETHDSTGAYMLVYKRKGQDPTNLFPADKDDSFWELPDHLKAAVSKDNEDFEQWVAELDAMRAETVSAGKERQTELRSLYEQMHIVSDESFDWLPAEWLVKWLAQKPPKKVPPVDNSSVVCPHNLLDPQKVEKMKCVSSRAADVIYEKFGGGPRLRGALCERCVGMQCRFLRVKAKVQADQKVISKLLKFKPSSDEPKVWVGKRSLQKWKHLALRPFGEQPSSSPSGDCNGVGQSTSTEHQATESDGGSSDQEENSTLFFNEDIKCQHGGLLPNDAARRLVGLNVWEVLKTHFPTAAEFPESSQVCELCQAHLERDLEAQGQLKQQAGMEKQRLSELLQERNRPSPSNLAPGETIYLLSREFLNQWKRFIRCPTTKARPQSIVNAVLLCPHQKLLCVPGSDDERLLLVWPSEWELIKEMFSVDIPIKVSGHEGPEAFLAEPEPCEPCRASAQLERSCSQKGLVFVRRVSSSELEHDQTKKPRLDGDESAAPTPAEESFVPRRCSARRRPRRGEREIHIAASQTLLDLKVQVMRAFSVAPFDQHLALEEDDGRSVTPLTENAATLAQLGVVPGSMLVLKVDESASADFEDCIPEPEPEVGFKGTKLQE